MQMAISGTQKALLNMPNGGPGMGSDLAVATVAGRGKQPRRLCFRVPAQGCQHCLLRLGQESAQGPGNHMPHACI